MLKKSLLAAALIATLVCLTACGSGNKKAETETTSEVPTAVAQDQTTTAEEKATTTTKAAEKETTTTKAADKETTTKAPKETTTKEEATTEAFAVPQAGDYQGGNDYEEEAGGGYYGVVEAGGDGLMLRNGPDSDYEFLSVVPDGTEIEILDVEDGWGYVSYDGVEGWVSLDYVY